MSEPSPQRTAIARRLREARKQAGLSQGQIARIMAMHRPTITEIEAGRRRVSADELASFAHHYGVSPAWLLGEEEELDAEVSVAARELEKLKPHDRQRVIEFLRSLAQGENSPSDS